MELVIKPFVFFSFIILGLQLVMISHQLIGVLNFWLNFKLHPLNLVKVQFSPLNFDHFNLVL